MSTRSHSLTQGNLSRTDRMMRIAARHYGGKRKIPEELKAIIQDHEHTRLSPTHLDVFLTLHSRVDDRITARSLVQSRFKDPQKAAAAVARSVAVRAAKHKIKRHDTAEILRVLLQREYPKGFHTARFMYQTKGVVTAHIALRHAWESFYGPKSIGVVNRFVLGLELALTYGYQPSRALIKAVENAIEDFAGFSGGSYAHAINLIEGTWVHGNNFRAAASDNPSIANSDPSILAHWLEP